MSANLLPADPWSDEEKMDNDPFPLTLRGCSAPRDHVSSVLRDPEDVLETQEYKRR